LSADPGSENNTQVYVSGVYQEKDTYSVSGTTLTFSTAPPTGTSNIEVVSSSPLAIGTPSDGTVTTAKLASTTGSGAVVLATSPTLVTPALGTPSAINLSNATALPASAMPSGTIVQVATSCPAPAHVELGTASWTEVSSSFRVSITPKNASNTLLIQCIFNFGGNFNSVLSHFKIYNVTNSADVNLHTGEGSRTPAHGSARQIDSDANDVDQMVLSTTVSAASTSARTYSLYSKNESGTTLKFFFGTTGNAASIVIARPTFVVYEISA
jgi:hypothetical protein